MFGSLFKKSNKSSQTTSTADNRVVQDASNGGRVVASGGALAEGSGSVTNVSGTGNTVTDGGAFAIVAKLADQLANVSTLQTTVARDIALRDSPMGIKYADAAVKAQEAAMTEASPLNGTALAWALALLAGIVVWKKTA